MKKSILIITLLFVNHLFSQSDKEIAIDFQNTLRTYYYHNDLKLDEELSIEASKWAGHLADNNIFKFETETGENLFSIKIANLPSNYNPYLDASVAWAIDADDEEPLNNMLDPEYKFVGIGMAKSNDEIIVVAKFR